MKKNYGKVNNLSNIIPFSKYSKKDSQNVTSTIAAIIAIKIDHPSDISPEDYFINQFRFSKFIKHNFRVMALQPSLFFNKKKRTLNQQSKD